MKDKEDYHPEPSDLDLFGLCREYRLFLVIAVDNKKDGRTHCDGDEGLANEAACRLRPLILSVLEARPNLRPLLQRAFPMIPLDGDAPKLLAALIDLTRFPEPSFGTLEQALPELRDAFYYPASPPREGHGTTAGKKHPKRRKGGRPPLTESERKKDAQLLKKFEEAKQDGSCSDIPEFCSCHRPPLDVKDTTKRIWRAHQHRKRAKQTHPNKPRQDP